MAGGEREGWLTRLVAARSARGGRLVTLALLITKAVGSRWRACAFALFDLISLTDAIHAGTSALVSWVAQTFLRLVLLSVIMAGQNVQAAED